MNEWARRTQQSEDVSTALSALDLTPCESELLSRAQIAGCVGTVPTRTSEWSRKELADAADNLTHFGLLQQAPSGASVVPGSDIPGATTQKARHDDSAAGAAAATRREQLHAAIMRRLDVVPSRLGVTRDMEMEFLDLLRNSRVQINSYPASFFEWPKLQEDSDRALETVRAADRAKVIDVVSSRRLRIQGESDFFRAVDRMPHCSVALADEVPLRLSLLDDTTAVIPIDPHASPLEGAWVIRDATAVAQVAVQLAVLIAESRPYASTERPSLELTAREVRVVQLLSAGMTDEAIARRLGIADRTVRRSVAELLKKVGAESRFGLAIECARRGLV